MCYPDWLPSLFPVSPWQEDTYDRLYQLFINDFKKSTPTYDGHIVWFSKKKEDGKEQIFWHLTSRDDKETGDRLPDLRRSERLPWARPMIDNPAKPESRSWDYREGDGSIRTYIWLPNFDYVIVMIMTSNGNRKLITAFWVEFPHAKRRLQKKYDNRI